MHILRDFDVLVPGVDITEEAGEVSGPEAGAGEVELFLLLPPGLQQSPHAWRDHGQQEGVGIHQPVTAVEHYVLGGKVKTRKLKAFCSQTNVWNHFVDLK